MQQIDSSDDITSTNWNIENDKYDGTIRCDYAMMKKKSFVGTSLWGNSFILVNTGLYRIGKNTKHVIKNTQPVTTPNDSGLEKKNDERD